MVKITNYFAGTTEVVFTATKDGLYRLSAAEGELNAVILIETETGSEMIELPYEFELKAGESITLLVSTSANVLTETEDTINLVVAEVEDITNDNNWTGNY